LGKKVQLAKRTKFQYYLAVTRQKFYRDPQVEKTWSKRLRPSGAAYRRLKSSKEENLTKCTGSTYAYVKNAEKIEKVAMRKVATYRKSKTHNRK